MRRTLAMLLAVLMALGVSGALAEVRPARLFADFSNGSAEGEALGLIRESDMAYDGDLDANKLAQGLSEWTGLDFIISSAEPHLDGIAVDWAADSTLIKGLDDRAQKEEFHFFDVESLNWFMMDSLARTIQSNLNVENVYYTMNGGQDLELPEMSVQAVFPADLPYMGSPFFYAHDDVKGDDEGYGELGYDDEAGYDDPYLVFIETVTLPGQEMEMIQHTSNGLYVTEGIAMDGDVAITSRSFEPLEDLGALEETAREWASVATAGLLIDETPGGEDYVFTNFKIFEDADYSAKTSYPCYLASWTSGANEDTRENLALIMLTDSNSMMYRFAVSVDRFEALRDQLYAVLDGLTFDAVTDD